MIEHIYDWAHISKAHPNGNEIKHMTQQEVQHCSRPHAIMLNMTCLSVFAFLFLHIHKYIYKVHTLGCEEVEQ
jgi:hypothetical protein